MKSLRLIPLALAAAALLSGCGKSTESVSSAPSLDTTPPAVPESMAMSVDNTSGQHYLSWVPSSAPDLAGYQVYIYSPDPTRDNSFVVVGETNGSVNRFEVPPVSRATSYYYRVRAIDQAGNRSGFTPTFEARLRPLATNPGSPNPLQIGP